MLPSFYYFALPLLAPKDIIYSVAESQNVELTLATLLHSNSSRKKENLVVLLSSKGVLKRLVVTKKCTQLYRLTFFLLLQSSKMNKNTFVEQ